MKEAFIDKVQKNGHNIWEFAVFVSAVMDCNILYTSISRVAELSTSKRRKALIEQNYPCVMSVEYILEQSGHTSTYIPILSMVQELFKNINILDKITEIKATSGQNVSWSNGSHFLENELLSTGNIILPL